MCIRDRLCTLLDDMYETMEAANGVGLAAPQVGLLRRIVVIDVGEGRIELINPEIIKTSGEQDGAEGCLSFPGEFGMVKRPMNVTVRAQDRNCLLYTSYKLRDTEKGFELWLKIQDCKRCLRSAASLRAARQRR